MRYALGTASKLTLLLAVADELAEHETKLYDEISHIGSCHIFLELIREENSICRDGRDGEEKDALNEGDECDVQDEEGDAGDIGLDNGPIPNEPPTSIESHRVNSPSIILRSDLISTSTPVIEGQSDLQHSVRRPIDHISRTLHSRQW